MTDSDSRTPLPPADFSPALPDYNSSGTASVSGTGFSASNAFGGPWYIETQSLNIEYTRVPTVSLNTMDVNLSSTSSTYSHYGSKIIANVHAQVITKMDFGTYQTSSWEQPQKFEILAVSSDVYGNSYGDLTASTLGPRGSIVTTQEYYRRIPWIGSASGQTEMTKVINAPTYYAVQNWTNNFSSTIDPTPYQFDLKAWAIDPKWDGAQSIYDPALYAGGTYLYGLGGEYGTALESLWKITNMISTIGTSVRDEILYSNPATTLGSVVVADVGIPEYDPTRHDYS